ncbi:glycine zipper 2TM domain-containing protein [Halomonas sp. M4R5S39]|uniref:Glycine zipper 2TM domain-containing protein n=1 Tax=Halomonas kalidii TaxID=3043293 RepID=A0ABT6VSF9_9GAMM|nr:glycine zipper 2TM domain-containing protein [Halomonas kalidii]MDI5936167.1 glycine zipper 2TM domain-containing protein [Halomonas kalidii]MDI5984274.1 glycine zipper 2TM domain-containing protein [Halomonas kalidii]
MSKSIVVGTTLAVLGLGGLAFGAWQVQQQESGPQYAEIVGVEALTRTVETPREVCEDVVVSQAAPSQAPSRDPHRIVGTAAGAIVGGLLGNQVGGGSGKKLATVAGAVGGGLAGREVQERVEANQRAQAAPIQTTQRQCHTVVDTHQETEGYEVTWQHGDMVQTSRLDNPPQGDRVLLEEGQPQWQAVVSQGG